MSTPVLDTVLYGRNGSSKPVPHDSTIKSFSTDETSVLGMLVSQTKDLVAAHWSRVNALLFVPDLFAVQQTKNRALWRKGRQLWDEVAIDDMVKSATREWIAAIGEDFRIIPAGDTAEDKFVSDAITAMFRGIPGGTLGKVNSILGGCGQGFSVTEVDYGVAAEGPAQGWFSIMGFRTLLPHFLVPEFDEDNKLVCVHQVDPYNRQDVRTLGADKMVHWVINEDVDPFSGGSIYVPCHQAWVCKQLVMQLRNYNCEWNAGRLEVSHTDAEGRILSEAQFKVRSGELIGNFLRLQGYRLWRGMAAKLVQSSTAPDLFNLVLRDCNQAISRAIGPPWLSSQESQYGNRALAEVHASTFENTIKPTRQYTQELLREGPIRQVCEMNGWAVRHRPDVSLEKAPAEDQQKVVNAFIAADAAGLVGKQSSDRNEIRGRLGWPLLKEQADAPQIETQSLSLNGAQIQSAVSIVQQITAAGLPAESALAMLTGFLPIPQAVAESIIGPLRALPAQVPPAPSGGPPEAAPISVGFSMPDPSPQFARQLFKTMTSKLPKHPLEVLEEKAHPAIDKAWKQATADFAKEAATWLDLPPASLVAKVRASKMDLEPLRTELEDSIVNAWHIGQEQATKELHKKGLRQVKKFDQVIPDPAALQDFKALLKSRSFKAVEGLGQEAMEAIAQKLEAIYSSGITHQEAKVLADRLFKDLIDSGQIVPGTPGHDVTFPEIRSTVLRTNMSSAFGEARMDLYQRNSDFVVGLERSEVGAGLEENSAPLSRIAHGLKIKLSDPRVRYIQGATGFNDRGVSFPITTLDAGPHYAWSSDAEIEAFIAAGRVLSPRFFP